MVLPIDEKRENCWENVRLDSENLLAFRSGYLIVLGNEGNKHTIVVDIRSLSFLDSQVLSACTKLHQARNKEVWTDANLKALCNDLSTRVNDLKKMGKDPQAICQKNEEIGRLDRSIWECGYPNGIGRVDELGYYLSQTWLGHLVRKISSTVHEIIYPKLYF